MLDKKNKEAKKVNNTIEKKVKPKKISKNKELFKLDIQDNIGFKDVLDGFLKIDKNKL